MKRLTINSDGPVEGEIIINYPAKWADEYRMCGYVKEWVDRYPNMFPTFEHAKHRGRLNPDKKLGYLTLFAQ